MSLNILGHSWLYPTKKIFPILSFSNVCLHAKGKNEMLSKVGDGWLSSVLDVQSLFFIKENWICAMTRHHAEANNISLTRNLPFDSDVRHWSHPLIIPLYCLWAKLNNRTRGQSKCDVTWFCFCFDFVRSHARCGCCSRVCLRFQVVQIKKVECKMSTKNMNNYK